MIAAILGLAGWAALANSPSPYAGEQGRPIKALSAEEQADLLAGRGMGLAKAGELNSFPGPAHVLALKSELQLDSAQLAATQKLFDAMQAEAQKLGVAIVALEGELDHDFASGAIDQSKVERLTGAIGALQGKLRAVHLQAHLALKKLLTPQQVAAYDKLRGYGDGMTKPSHDGHNH
jgi:Spy/CpxP family protein refolding chaperone